MTSPYTSDPRVHIEQIAQDMKEISEISAPDWAQFVKTGPHKQRQPQNKDWWHMRVAAVLRTVGARGPVGVNKLRKKYGGRQRRGHKPARFARAGGSVLRKSLQQLEKAGLVQQVDLKGHKGRVVTAKGQSLLAQTAKKVTKA